MNLGSDFPLPAEQWSTLCKRIAEILHGQRSFLHRECDVDKLAHNLASRILTKNQEVKQESPDYRTVNLDSIKTYRPRSIGCGHVVLETLRALELDAKLTSLGFNGIQAALAIGTIVGRACHPASKRETHRWLQGQSGLGELIDFDFQQVGLNRIYTVSDQLLKHKDAIEHHLYEKNVRFFRLVKQSPCMT